MRKLVLALASVAALSACSESSQADVSTVNTPVLPESELAKFKGVYAGSYVCSLGENGLTLSIDTVVDLIGTEASVGKVDARLWF